MNDIKEVKEEVQHLIEHRWNSLYKLAEMCEVTEPTMRKALKGTAANETYHKILFGLKQLKK